MKKLKLFTGFSNPRPKGLATRISNYTYLGVDTVCPGILNSNQFGNHFLTPDYDLYVKSMVDNSIKVAPFAILEPGEAKKAAQYANMLHTKYGEVTASKFGINLEPIHMKATENYYRELEVFFSHLVRGISIYVIVPPVVHRVHHSWYEELLPFLKMSDEIVPMCYSSYMEDKKFTHHKGWRPGNLQKIGYTEYKEFNRPVNIAISNYKLDFPTNGPKYPALSSSFSFQRSLLTALKYSTDSVYIWRHGLWQSDVIKETVRSYFR